MTAFSPSRPRFLSVLPLTGAACLLAASVVHAQSYPTRAPKLVVPFVAGGISDFIGRVVAEGVQEPLGTALVIENRAGAGGNVGMDYVAKSAPDGYTLGLATVGLASNSALQSRMPFDALKDFTPVIGVGSIPSVIVVHPALPVKTVGEFIALAKKHPGELAYGSSGLGTGSHLVVELFSAATNTKMTHIPYKGTAQAIPDLLAGRIQFMFDFPTTAIQPIKAGRLKGLAVTSAKRSAALPDLPTVSEAGVKGFEFGTWAGVLAPSGLPPAIADKLTVSLAKALENPATRNKLAQQAIEVQVMQPQQFGTFIKTDIERWKHMVREGRLAMLD
ncbi:MAG: Bug family tripartite tricarboxylate transporter substrate binding protein [Burkholderiales bacterium]